MEEKGLSKREKYKRRGREIKKKGEREGERSGGKWGEKRIATSTRDSRRLWPT